MDGNNTHEPIVPQEVAECKKQVCVTNQAGKFPMRLYDKRRMTKGVQPKMAHLYASFADASLAEKAAGALLDYGVRQEDISLVAHDDYGKTRAASYGTDAYGTNYAGSTAAGVGRGVSNVGDSAIDATQSAGHRLAQAGDRVAGAVTGAVGATGTAAGFEAAGDYHAAGAEGRAAMAGNEAAVHGSATQAGIRSHDLDPMDEGDQTVDAHNDTNMAAKHGISTTTPQDAGAGAMKGAGIGLGVGILASLAALAIPGFGLVLGGGALAAAIGATAATAGAGAVAGGVTGYLKEQGVPGEAAQRYHGVIEHGGAMLSINVPSGSVDQATAEQVLGKYGAADVGAY